MSTNLRDIVVGSALGLSLAAALACKGSYNPKPAVGVCAGEVDNVNSTLVKMLKEREDGKVYVSGDYNNEASRNCFHLELRRTSGGKFVIQSPETGLQYIVRPSDKPDINIKESTDQPGNTVLDVSFAQ